MGAGKSTMGPILANTLGWDYYDLDREVELKTGTTIPQIFEEKGESYFRKLESETLKEISKGDNLIISLGGGTIASGDNLQVLKKVGYIIYLKTSIGSVYKRLIYKNDRPVLKVDENSDNPEEDVLKKINSIFTDRKPFYEQADFTVDTENITIGKTVDYLAHLIISQIKGQKH